MEFSSHRSCYQPLIIGGYLAFGAGIPSDHRLLWIDILATGLGLGWPCEKPDEVCGKMASMW